MADFSSMTDLEFNGYVIIAAPYLLTNATRLNVSSDNQTALTNQSSSWSTTWGLYSDINTRTKTITQNKNDQRAALEQLFMLIFKDMPHSALNNNDANALHVIITPDEATPAPVMDHPPIGELEKTGPFRYKLRFHEPTTPESRKMPDGQAFIMALLYLAPEEEEEPQTETLMAMAQGSTLKSLLSFYHTGRNYIDIVIPEQLKGRTGLLQWCYINTRGIASPMDPPIDFLIS